MRDSRTQAGRGWSVWWVGTVLALTPGAAGCGHAIGLFERGKGWEPFRRTYTVRATPGQVMAHLEFNMPLVYAKKSMRYVNVRGRRVARYKLVRRGRYTLDIVDRFAKTKWPFSHAMATYGTRYEKHTTRRDREKLDTIRGGQGNKVRGWITTRWTETKTHTTAHRVRTGTKVVSGWSCAHESNYGRPVVRAGRAVDRVTVRWDPRRRVSVVSFRAIGAKICMAANKRRWLVEGITQRRVVQRPPRTGLNRMVFVTTGGAGYRYTHSDWETNGSWNIPTRQRQHSAVVDYADFYWGADRFDLHLRVGDLAINLGDKKVALERDVKVEYLQRLAATAALFGTRGLFARTRTFYLGLGGAVGFMHWNAPGEVPGIGDPPRADLTLYGVELGPSLTIRFPLSPRWPVTMLLMSSYLISVYGRARLTLAAEQFDKRHLGDHHIYGQALLSVKVARRTFVDAGVFFSYRIAEFEGIKMRGFTITPLARLSWGF